MRLPHAKTTATEIYYFALFDLKNYDLGSKIGVRDFEKLVVLDSNSSMMVLL